MRRLRRWLKVAPRIGVGDHVVISLGAAYPLLTLTTVEQIHARADQSGYIVTLVPA